MPLAAAGSWAEGPWLLSLHVARRHVWPQPPVRFRRGSSTSIREVKSACRTRQGRLRGMGVPECAGVVGVPFHAKARPVLSRNPA